LGSEASSSSPDGTESLGAIVHLQVGVALCCMSIALVVSTVTLTAAAVAQPQPDPAPAPPAIAPDPAPGTSPVGPAPSQPETSTPPVQPEPPAPLPAEPQGTPNPSPAVTPKPDKAPAAQNKSARSRRPADGQGTERHTKSTPAAAEPQSLVGVGSLLPDSEPATDDSHRLFLLAAGALLALLIASGSLISVASRATRGRLR
jgi:outer membrane biosynthesis protein TonB